MSNEYVNSVYTMLLIAMSKCGLVLNNIVYDDNMPASLRVGTDGTIKLAQGFQNEIRRVEFIIDNDRFQMHFTRPFGTHHEFALSLSKYSAGWVDGLRDENLKELYTSLISHLRELAEDKKFLLNGTPIIFVSDLEKNNG